MNFKEHINADIDVFMNEDEFSGKNNINGIGVNVIIDKERLNLRQTKDFEGALIGDILYFIKVSDYPGKPPKVGDVQRFNGKPYTIVDIKEPDGLFEIILGRNFS